MLTIVLDGALAEGWSLFDMFVYVVRLWISRRSQDTQKGNVGMGMEWNGMMSNGDMMTMQRLWM